MQINRFRYTGKHHHAYGKYFRQPYELMYLHFNTQIISVSV